MGFIREWGILLAVFATVFVLILVYHKGEVAERGNDAAATLAKAGKTEEAEHAITRPDTGALVDRLHRGKF
jgi:hypothetical protein